MIENIDTQRSEDFIDDFINDDAEFTDNYQTREQKARDCEITKLLQQYISAYSMKVNTQRTYRRVLLILCTTIIALFTVSFLVILIYLAFNSSLFDITDIISLVSICITFLVSVLSLTQIIAKYCFPENDEEYISKIVSTIQTNDFQHKIANMKDITDISSHTDNT